MDRTLALLLAVATLAVPAAHAAVFCAKPNGHGAFNGAVKIRESCKRNEVQLTPEQVGFCCTTTTVTTTTDTTAFVTTGTFFTTTSEGCPETTTSTAPLRCEYFGSGSCGAGACPPTQECMPNGADGCVCVGEIVPQPCGAPWGGCSGFCPVGLVCRPSYITPGGCLTGQCACQ